MGGSEYTTDSCSSLLGEKLEVTRLQILDPVHTEQERCRLENGYGIHLPVASLAASLGCEWCNKNQCIPFHLVTLSLHVNRPLGVKIKIGRQYIDVGTSHPGDHFGWLS